MTEPADVIVVGSGPSAVSAAWPLAQGGAKVLMLDVGNEDSSYASIIPPASFVENRRSDPRQHRYFLGDSFEGVPLGRVRVGAQLTPPRQHVARDTDTLTPLLSSSFHPTESLALGGLGSAWGASAVEFDDRDMEGWPIGRSDLAPHYKAVSQRIGISGARDDLLVYYGDSSTLQPPLEVDDNGRRLLERYEARRDELNRGGLFAGHPRLAVLTRDLEDRRATSYGEMEFYSDAGGSVYRPWQTVRRMSSLANFTYERPWLVERFEERADRESIDVIARHARDGQRRTFRARRLVLGAGAMGTARIVLRSFDRYDRPVPILTNSHVYAPCVSFSSLGRPMPDRRHGLTQVGLILDPERDGRRVVYVEAHGYRSLLTFKLVKESFLPVPEAVAIFRGLMSALTILVIEHEDRPSPGKTCLLRRAKADGAEPLEVSYRPDESQQRRQRDDERRLLRLVRRLGCWPLGRVDPGHGASIHYGGCVPMTARHAELTCEPTGLLRGTRTVSLVDGSSLPTLPAKPLTFTLMALGDRVGRRLLEEFR